MARIRKRANMKTYELEIEKTKSHPRIYKSGFRTKSEAIKEARRIESLLEQGKYNTAHTDITLSELFNMWLTVEIDAQDLDPDTKKRYRRRQRWIEDYFGDVQVNQILRSHYQMFINRYGEHYEINEVGRMNANIVKAIEFAKADLIDVDDRFLLNIKLNSKRKPKEADKKFIHRRLDYEKLVDYLLIYMDYRKTVLPHIMYLILQTGLRPSEALALTWSDVDFKKQEIYTHRRWSSTKMTFAPAKNDNVYRKLGRRNPSKRYIPFNGQVLGVLEELKSLQERMLKVLGLENAQGFVFFQVGGIHPVPDESSLNKAFKRVLKKLDIEPIITIYGARHTYGSIKVQEGVPIEVLAKWFGHKDTITLQETYIHLLEETRDEWFEKEKNRETGTVTGTIENE
ncbi:tyrosine-type recombinase/integrase [Streptococcus merionis]|uniref:tyrosine-type recombinase/integrase n=1 Tax=Streptococcus merionis TaxID=400065 RepID=UPI003511A05A